MRALLRSTALIASGVAIGFAAAHLINSTPRGRAFFARINETAESVVAAVREGYSARTEAIYAAIDPDAR